MREQVVLTNSLTKEKGTKKQIPRTKTSHVKTP